MARTTIKIPTLPTASDVQQAMDRLAQAATTELRRGTDSWKTQPGWSTARRGYDRIVTTENEIYAYQDDGTRPHEIRPRRARMLRWYGAGGGAVFARKVNHPGTAAQHLTKQAAARFEARVPALLKEAS